MKIYLDGELADVTLESEKNDREVVEALEAWVESQGFLISDLKINGKTVNLLDGALGSMPVADMERVDLSLMSPLQYGFMVLGELDAYLERWRIRLEKPEALDEAELQSGLEGVAWIRTTLERAVKPLHLTAEAAPVLAQVKELEIACYRLSGAGGGVGEFRTRMDEALAVLSQGARTLFRRGYFQLLRQALSRMNLATARGLVLAEGDRLKTMITKLLPEAALELQKGRDTRAMPLVQAAAESLELLLTLLDRAFTLIQIEMGTGLRERENHKPLLDHLTALEAAFTRQDVVALGDLLEYEIPEVLEPVWESLAKLPSALPA